MRRESRLDAGTHWVYATGSIGGPVVYNIPKIRDMQRQRTIEAVQKKDASRKAELNRRQQAIEIYDEAAAPNQRERPESWHISRITLSSPQSHKRDD